MNEHQLEEMTAQETSQVEKIVGQLRRKIAEHKPISASELYPEMALKSPYTYCIGNVKAATLLPFFSTVIVDLRPLPSLEAFESRYGLSPERFIEYVEQGRIAVRCRDKYERFEGLSYLDPIFQILGCPPSSIRHKYLYAEDQLRLFSIAREMIGMARPEDDWWRREYADWKTPPMFTEVFADKFALVGCYFGEETASELVRRAMANTQDPGQAYKWLHVFSRARVYPYMNCLDGINSLSLEDLRLTSSLPTDVEVRSRQEYARPRKWYDFLRRNPRPQMFPYELGKVMLTNMRLSIPADLDTALQIVPADWNAAVRELDKALEAGMQVQIEAKSRYLIRLVKEVSSEVATMRRRQKQYANLITLAGVGIVGPLAEYAPADWKPLVQAAGASLVVLKTPIASALVRMLKPSHVTAWFDIEAQLKPTAADS